MDQHDSKKDNKPKRKTRLTQYRKHGGRWQFFAVARKKNGQPNAEQVMIAGKPQSWESRGAKYYLDWLDPVTEKRTREIAGVTPREARDASLSFIDWPREGVFLHAPKGY